MEKESNAIPFWRSGIIRAIFGASLGMLVGLLLVERYELPLWVSIVFDSIYGALVMGATVIYDFESLSLTQSTVFHLLVTFGGFCILGLIQGWLARVPLWILVVFLVGYFLIWSVQWMMCFQRVRRINKALRQWHNGEKEE